MKNLLTIAVLSAILLFFGLFAWSQVSEAQRREANLAAALLELPAPPPLNPSDEDAQNFKTARADEFYSRKSAPGDDAPIADLLAYWQKMNGVARDFLYVPEMSQQTAQRLFAEIEKKPELLPELLNSLPDNAETANFVKNAYDRQVAVESAKSEDQDEEDGVNESQGLKKWLVYHTDYFSDELLKEAQKSSETADYITNQEEVLAVAKVDWDKARPLVERLLADDSKPIAQTLARWAFYKHALAENDASDTDKYRAQLQATVEDKSAKPGERDLAMDAIVHEKDFAGRDDWYYTLLSDETLYELRANGGVLTGLTTIINHSPPDKYTAKMIELLASDSKTVRAAAILNLTALLGERDERVVRALIPWLENPDWARETGGQRQELVRALSNFQIPESVPGLIATLNEKGTRQVYDLPNDVMLNTNMSVSLSSGGVMSNRAPQNYKTVEYYPYRSAAISALAKQKDARAVSALRAVLAQTQDYERNSVVEALLECGGYTIPEQIAALEKTAQMISSRETVSATRAITTSPISESSMSIEGDNSEGVSDERSVVEASPVTMTNRVVGGSANTAPTARPFDLTDAQFILGNLLTRRSEVSDELVAAVDARINELNQKNPPLADALRGILRQWSGAAVNSILLRDLKNDTTDAGAVVKLLTVRGELREKQSNEVYALRTEGAASNPFARGVAACLLDDANVYEQSLAAQIGAEEKASMLACARLIRARLPVKTVAENLNTANKTLARAAELYLESEDSAEARRIVLSLHPNEAKILGATTAFTSSAGYQMADDGAGHFLPALFSSVNGAADVPYYMLFPGENEFDATEKQLQKEAKENADLLGIYAYDKNFVRIYKDKAVFSWEEDEARYKERTLEKAEFDGLQNLLAARHADELPPFLSYCDECESKELLMLGRAGGRRVFYRTAREPEFFTELDKTFAEMRVPLAHLHYHLEKGVGGLEVLFADENLKARAVWKDGDDFRVVIEDEERGKQIEKELDRLDRSERGKENFDYEKGEETQRRRREQREYENFEWRKFAFQTTGASLEKRLGALTAQPRPLEYIPARDSLLADAQPSDEQWKARTTAGVEIRVGDADGLYKVAGGRAAKLRGGDYYSPVVSPDGRWVLVGKSDSESIQLVRVNLATGKEFKTNLDQNMRFEAVAFDASINKFLIHRGGYDEDGEQTNSASLDNADYLLLDPETGLAQAVKGEVRPLGQQTFRPLQPATAADEFWAAIPDKKKNETRVGIYNAKTLVFKSRLTVPRIKFDSMDLWADEPENKIYFVYEGHLLALPLPKNTETRAQ